MAHLIVKVYIHKTYGHSLQMQVLYLSFCNKCCLFFIANSSCLFIFLSLGSWGLWIISVKFHWHFTEISMKEFSNISVRYHWNFSEIILQHFSEMSLKFQWNITEISVKCHWNFSEISLKFTEMLENYFTDISVKFLWYFTEISVTIFSREVTSLYAIFYICLSPVSSKFWLINKSN